MLGRKLQVATSAVSDTDFVAAITPPAGKSFNYYGGTKVDTDGTVYHLISTDETDAQIDLQLIKFEPDASVGYKKAYAFGSSTGTTQVPTNTVLGGTDVKIVGAWGTYSTAVATLDTSGTASTPNVVMNLTNAVTYAATNVSGGNYWVSGDYRFSSTYQRVGFIVKVSASNNTVVSTLHTGTASPAPRALSVRGLNTDGAGNLYGLAWDDLSNYDYRLFKVADTGGAASWVRSYSVGSFDRQIATDANTSGNSAVLYINSTTNIAYIDFVNSSGSVVWSRQHSVGVAQSPVSVYIDADNDVYYTYGREATGAFFLVKVNSSGTFVYRRSFSFSALPQHIRVSGDLGSSTVVVANSYYVIKADGDNFFTGTYQGVTVANSPITLSSSTTQSVSSSATFSTRAASTSSTSVFTKTANPTVSISTL